MFCLDKPKFGGPNKKKNACQARKCVNMSTKSGPEQSEVDDLSDESMIEEGGVAEDSFKDLSCSEKLDFIPEDHEDVKKIDIKPVTRGSANVKKETSAKPAVKKRRISLDESEVRQKPPRNNKSLVTKQKRYSATNS